MRPFAEAIAGEMPGGGGRSGGYTESFNYERMFDGATIYIRNEKDARELAKQIHELGKARGRGTGFA